MQRSNNCCVVSALSFHCGNPPSWWILRCGSEFFPFPRVYWYESVAFWNLPPLPQFKPGQNVSSLDPSMMNLGLKVLFRLLIDGVVASPVELHGKDFCCSSSVADGSSTHSGRACLFLVVTGSCSKLHQLRRTSRCAFPSKSVESQSERMPRRQS